MQELRALLEHVEQLAQTLHAAGQILRMQQAALAGHDEPVA